MVKVLKTVSAAERMLINDLLENNSKPDQDSITKAVMFRKANVVFDNAKTQDPLSSQMNFLHNKDVGVFSQDSIISGLPEKRYTGLEVSIIDSSAFDNLALNRIDDFLDLYQKVLDLNSQD